MPLSISRRLGAFARDWRVKVAIQNTLGLIPGKSGFCINERLTKLIRGQVSERTDAKIRFFDGADNISLIRKRIDNFCLQGKCVLEIGTGWHGIDVLIFYLLGAKKIITMDQFPHLSLASVMDSCRALEDAECRERLTSIGMLEERLDSLRNSVNDVAALPELLQALNVEYRIVTSSQYQNLRLDGMPIDLLYSYSVLQRIQEKHLRDLFRTLSSSLADNAVSYHVTDQKDINAQSHVDNKLWSLRYLGYSDWLFNLFLSGKFNSQNRLRESDFLQIFLESGLTPRFVESRLNAEDLVKLKHFKTAKRFRDKTIEDLAILQSKILCIKGDGEEKEGITRNVIQLP